MKCPFCEQDDDRVLDSRPSNEGTAVRRRRECGRCGRRFTTFEYVERTPLMVIKRDGRHEPYDRNKVLAGVLLACRKRPVSRTEIDKLVDAVESELAEENCQEVSSAELGERVLTRLGMLDPVAYVRFASVYRKFNSPEQFVEELKNLGEGGSSARDKTATP